MYPPPPPPAERQGTPPPRKAVQELNSPNQRDGFFTELVSREDPAYQKFVPIGRGTPYASIPGADERIIEAFAANPLYFLKQLRPGTTSASDFGSTDLWVLWVWSTQGLAQDSYNSETTYEEDGVSFPIYQREYDVKRQLWEANPTLTVLSTLTGLLSVAITAAGTNYTQATGTVGTATAEAVILNGAIIDWIVTREGSGITNGAGLTIVGDGTGATATARVQPASAVLVSQREGEFSDDDPKSHDYVRVIRTYMTLPGPVLTNTFRSAQVRGRTVQQTIQKAATGTIPVETGALIISSETQALTTVIDQRTTNKVASLPPQEKWAYWDFVPLPKLVFDIVNTIYCDGTQFGTIITDPVTGGGSSVLRKHRVTVDYYDGITPAGPPNPDLSGSSFTTADLSYAGRFVHFDYGNVLNDAISYSQVVGIATGGDACSWTEAYSFSATTPSAATFLAGDWYVRDYKVEQWGDTGWKSTKTEFYSASGNPSI